ncbi:MAG: ABC transporter permease [Geminicoccaceae bacterium]
MSWLAAHREIVLALVIALMVAAIGSYAPAFVEGTSLLGVLDDTALLFMLALGQMVVILTRGIDLSIAANLALTGMLVALVGQYGPDLPALAYIALAILIGLGFGLGNGLLIGGLGIPPIVVTLGTLSIFRGMIVVIGGGDQVNASEMGRTFQAFPHKALLGLSSVFWIALAVAILMQLFLSRTRTGRGIYAVGGNPTAARYCGLVLERYQVLVYAIAGGIAGLSGYLWVARYGVAYSEIASGFELTIIASCVIGGVSIGGGVGTVPGTLLGALFIGVIVNALPTMQVSPFWQMAISGAAILAAVIINARAEAHPDKLILPEARRAAAGARG